MGADARTVQLNEVLGYPLTAFPRVTERAMKKKLPRRPIDVDVEELDRVIDGAEQAAKKSFQRRRGGT